ncbi:MAG: sodium-dependent transporter [Pseudomonadota bacterium]|nr:sodium-dependent transporter [Pseudomonadota bacterium]
MMNRTSIHGQWSSRLTFILAATGSAVGLGNIWKFPYMVGENGGGAFVLIYLLCVAAIGIPIMIAEIMVGRRGRQNPMDSMRLLAEDDQRNPAWQWVGLIGVIAGVLILSYYSVIAGWALAYVFRAGSGQLAGADADSARALFTDLVSNPEALLAWHTVIMATVVLVTSRGVEGGLEKAAQWLMPALFALLLVMVGYGISAGAFEEAMVFLFQPDFSKIDGAAVLAAMGQAFFSMSLGMGAIMIYGSYLPQDASIPRSATMIAISDTGVALLAGLAIFPVVFLYNLEPGEGPGLIFMTLPIAFGQMTGGTIFATLFFLLLVVAALTSAVSLIEPSVAFLVERLGMTRVAATACSGIVIWFIGLGTVLSFNVAADWTLWGKTFFDLLDFTTANIMLPLGGVAIAIFAAWIVSAQASGDELSQDAEWVHRIWRILCRYVAPVAVLLVFLNLVGVFA